MAIIGGAIIGGAALAGTLYSSWSASKQAGALDAQTRAATAAAIKKYQDNYKLPEIDRTPLTQEEFQLVGQYAPQIASYIQEKSPQMISESGSVGAKQAQEKALSKLSNLSERGEDAQAKAQREREIANAEGERRRQSESLLRTYQERGLGGGGQELVASMAGGQQADQARRQTALDVAAQNEARRNQALNQMAGLAGDMRGQNLQVESANTSAINAFNQRNAQTKQAYENNVANTLNDAQMKNLQARQTLANANTGLRNDTNRFNFDRRDRIEETDRNAANDMQRDMLNASIGQASQARQSGQDRIGREQAMTNQAFQGLASIYGGVAAQQQGARADARADRSLDIQEMNARNRVAYPDRNR